MVAASVQASPLFLRMFEVAAQPAPAGAPTLPRAACRAIAQLFRAAPQLVEDDGLARFVADSTARLITAYDLALGRPVEPSAAADAAAAPAAGEPGEPDEDHAYDVAAAVSEVAEAMAGYIFDLQRIEGAGFAVLAALVHVMHGPFARVCLVTRDAWYALSQRFVAGFYDVDREIEVLVNQQQQQQQQAGADEAQVANIAALTQQGIDALQAIMRGRIEALADYLLGGAVAVVSALRWPGDPARLDAHSAYDARNTRRDLCGVLESISIILGRERTLATLFGVLNEALAGAHALLEARVLTPDSEEGWQAVEAALFACEVVAPRSRDEKQQSQWGPALLQQLPALTFHPQVRAAATQVVGAFAGAVPSLSEHPEAVDAVLNFTLEGLAIDAASARRSAVALRTVCEEAPRLIESRYWDHLLQLYRAAELPADSAEAAAGAVVLAADAAKELTQGLVAVVAQMDPATLPRALDEVVGPPARVLEAAVQAHKGLIAPEQMPSSDAVTSALAKLTMVARHLVPRLNVNPGPLLALFAFTRPVCSLRSSPLPLPFFPA